MVRQGSAPAEKEPRSGGAGGGGGRASVPPKYFGTEAPDGSRKRKAPTKLVDELGRGAGSSGAGSGGLESGTQVCPSPPKTPSKKAPPFSSAQLFLLATPREQLCVLL